MVTETYPPEVNGVARTMERMVEGLRARGHAIQLVRPRQGRADRAAAAPAYSELLRPGVRLPRYPQLRIGLPSGRALRKAWSRERPDIVHIATEGPLGWSALSAARSLAIPVATDFHTNFHSYARHYGLGWLQHAVGRYLRFFHNRGACTLVPTPELAEVLRTHGIRRLRVVGRGVDHRTFSPERRSARLRAEWGADERTPVALCVSRLAAEKNLALALEAHRAMRAVHPRALLVLVGDGPLREELRRRAGEGVVFAGAQFGDRLAEHYASADVFLFPSTTETFGNVTLEAMASALAVVAYDYAAARQYLAHGRSGLLAPPADRQAFVGHAVRLAGDLAWARALGRAARAAARQLDWTGAVAQFESALLAAVAAGAPQARAGS